jgi:molybdate/tungstate transport system ATP-binding protein
VQQIPVLYVTHDLKEAGALGDRFAVIVDGTVREIETVDQAFDHIKHDRIQGPEVAW